MTWKDPSQRVHSDSDPSESPLPGSGTTNSGFPLFLAGCGCNYDSAASLPGAQLQHAPAAEPARWAGGGEVAGEEHRGVPHLGGAGNHRLISAGSE